MALPLLATSVVLTGFGAAQQYKSARKAAAVDSATADYNAKVDQAQAQQLALDTAQNIRTEREENKVYLSKREADYAASGVLTTGGSPLHTQITAAGRLEQQIQQQYISSQQKQQQLYSAAKAGVLMGQAQAEADRARGTIALLDGGARIAGLGFEGYRAGVFGGGSSSGGAGPIGLTG